MISRTVKRLTSDDDFNFLKTQFFPKDEVDRKKVVLGRLSLTKLTTPGDVFWVQANE